MVDKVKRMTRTTAHRIQTAYEVGAIAATIAAAVKVATLNRVDTSFGQLPLWQAVAAILLAGEAFRIYMLLVKE